MKRINSGTMPQKVSKQWKLIRVFQRIQDHLQNLHIVSFHHVRRKANKLANLLANQGVSNIEVKVLLEWQELRQSRLRTLCCKQEEEDRRVFRHKAREASTSLMGGRTRMVTRYPRISEMVCTVHWGKRSGYHCSLINVHLSSSLGCRLRP